MNKKYGSMFLLPLMVLFLSSCGRIGEKSLNLSVVYGVTAALSLLLLAGCILLAKKRDKWFLLLFASVFIVNTGYLLLATAHSLDGALWANRLAYLGSVCLPLSMLMIILNVCRLQYGKMVPGILIVLSAAVFLLAASPGISTLYYKEVGISTLNGITVLDKVYGPLHPVYLFYLLAYFAAMLAAIAYSAARKKLVSTVHAASLAAAVFVNIVVWLLEQLVRIDFELLSVSYIITEVFLISIDMMLQESRRSGEAPLPAPEEALPPAEPCDTAVEVEANPSFSEQCAHFASQYPKLTPTERTVFDSYLSGMRSSEIMAELNIKQNTLKYHNRNIYSKLGVTSRRQMLEIAAALDIRPVSAEKNEEA